MIVSHEHRFIFIHIPRTAGTSIEKSLCAAMGIDDMPSFIGERRSNLEKYARRDGYNYVIYPERQIYEGQKHITAKHLKSYVGERIWNSYFKFSFVRNPFDHTLSVYLKYIKELN